MKEISLNNLDEFINEIDFERNCKMKIIIQTLYKN